MRHLSDNSLFPLVAGLAVLLLLAVAWQAGADAGLISKFLLPPPTDIAEAMPALVEEDELVTKAVITIGSTLAATAIAVVAGIAIGWVLYLVPILGRAYETWLGAVFSAPVILLYPLFLVIFGRGVLTVVVIAVAVGIIPVILSSLEGFRAVPRVYLRVAESMRMSRRETIFKVLLPSALPNIFTGIRLSMMYTMIYVLSLEFMVGVGGLGALLGDQHDRFNNAAMMAVVVCIVAISTIFYYASEGLERWLKSQLA